MTSDVVTEPVFSTRKFVTGRSTARLKETARMNRIARTSRKMNLERTKQFFSLHSQL